MTSSRRKSCKPAGDRQTSDHNAVWWGGGGHTAGGVSCSAQRFGAITTMTHGLTTLRVIPSLVSLARTCQPPGHHQQQHCSSKAGRKTAAENVGGKLTLQPSQVMAPKWIPLATSWQTTHNCWPADSCTWAGRTAFTTNHKQPHFYYLLFTTIIISFNG